jgi:subtilisin family serine protease
MSDGNGARYDLHGSAWRGRTHEGADIRRGQGYLYRPGHILLEDDQEYTAAVADHLVKQAGAVPHDEFTAHFSHAGLPVRAFQVGEDEDIPALVERLREHEHGKPTPNVGPNHVFTGEYEYSGGPENDPEWARPSEEPTTGPHAGPPRVAVLDTGYDHAVKHLHPALEARLEYGGDEDSLVRAGFLAHEAGHGTFIAGIIMKHAPELRIRQVRVLDPAGVGDDVSVARGLARADSTAVINLSLGGYTHGGRPPVALATALAQLSDSVAVVAAAGNNGSPEPFWPAAFKRVIAVGALDTTNGEITRASFSNYGHWVDVYAPGTNVHSTYLDGEYREKDKHLAHLAGWAVWSGTSFAAPQIAAEVAKRVRAGVTPRQAAYEFLSLARWYPGIGPVLIPRDA